VTKAKKRRSDIIYGKGNPSLARFDRMGFVSSYKGAIKIARGALVRVKLKA